MSQYGHCEDIKSLEGFFDKALNAGAVGYGSACMECKAKAIKPLFTKSSSKF